MIRIQHTGFIVFIVTFSTCASTFAPPQQTQRADRPAAVSLQKVDRRLARDRSEVKRLQRDVGRQEGSSKRATERLQQQDQAINALREQLNELQARQSAGLH